MYKQRNLTVKQVKKIFAHRACAKLQICEICEMAYDICKTASYDQDFHLELARDAA